MRYPTVYPSITRCDRRHAAIEGIADGFVPGIFQRHGELVDEMTSVSSDDAVQTTHELAHRHGLLCRPSSGAHWVAAPRVRDRHPPLRTVVTLFCDEGDRYLQDYFLGPARPPPEPAPFA